MLVSISWSSDLRSLGQFSYDSKGLSRSPGLRRRRQILVSIIALWLQRIERQGFPNPKLERRPLRNLFTPKASRVLRALLEDAKQTWKVQAMARQARVSLGLAFKVKQRLLDLEYAREEDEGLRLIKPEELLRQWAANYSNLKSDALDCFATGDPPRA